MTLLDDPNHWRDRAIEARAQAEQLGDEQARVSMLQVANGYDQLADRAEERAFDQLFSELARLGVEREA